MSAESSPGFTPTGTIASSADRRRVVFATVIGTTVEWYDFFIYSSATALVFGHLFFSPFGKGTEQILAFLTIGISFLFRPFGAFLAGHFGDRIGRRAVLMITLILMGASTALIGLLPTASAIGFAAPILLILLRVLQGISAGGEWGGAVLMAVEHAPRKKRGLFGAAPQIGVPLGLLLASGVMAVMSAVAPGEAFLVWGWRVPFLLSIVLILVGYYVRRRVEESPVFTEIAERREQTRMPIVQLFRKHALLVIIAALVFAGNNAVGYMTTGGYIQNYATDPAGPVRLDKGPVLWAVAGSAVTWLLFAAFGGWISDRIGRRTTYIAGWILQLIGVFALFPLVNQGTVGIAVRRTRDPHDRPRPHVRAAGGAVRGTVPRIDPVLRSLDLVRDRRDPGRRVRAHDREGAGAGDRFDAGRHLVPRRHDRDRPDRDAAAARPQRDPARPGGRGGAGEEPDLRSVEGLTPGTAFGAVERERQRVTSFGVVERGRRRRPRRNGVPPGRTSFRLAPTASVLAQRPRRTVLIRRRAPRGSSSRSGPAVPRSRCRCGRSPRALRRSRRGAGRAGRAAPPPTARWG